MFEQCYAAAFAAILEYNGQVRFRDVGERQFVALALRFRLLAALLTLLAGADGLQTVYDDCPGLLIKALQNTVDVLDAVDGLVQPDFDLMPYIAFVVLRCNQRSVHSR